MSRTDPETIYSLGEAGYTDYPLWNSDNPENSVVGLDGPEDVNPLLKPEAQI